MSEPIQYGAWSSPVSARDVAADTLDIGGVALDSGTAVWLERRPEEGGRGVLVSEDIMGQSTDTVEQTELLPSDVDVRTTVHEYGGGDFAVQNGTVVYSRFDDQRLYLVADAAVSAEPEPITPEPPENHAWRYANMAFTPGGERVYCVRERHCGEDVTDEAVNELVVVSVSDADPPTVVASGHDFYAYPRVSPDGTRLAWTTWDHPRMPWDGTELHVAAIGSDGMLDAVETVAGGPEESIYQPGWGPDGTLYFASDRTGWWNLYRREDGEQTAIREEEAEYGGPQWGLGSATYQVLDDGRLVAIRTSDGRQELVVLDPETGVLESADLPYDAYPHSHLSTDGDAILCVAAGPKTPVTVVYWEPGSDPQELRQAFTLDVSPDTLSEPTHITYPTGADGTEQSHMLYYPPTNPAVEAPPDENPPLLVMVHGGPTAQTLPVANPTIQYFTTRGFAVADVNYRGSTGYGRAYRDRLKGDWGAADTLDCVEAARYLASEDLVDPERLAIRGGSAGGYATLCALAFHKTFDAGASYYGVADLQQLAEHTHKFESRYLDSLVGPLPDAVETYEERSPANHAENIDAPLLVLQGGEDRVVPPGQADQMVDELVESETAYAYIEFPEERHGFRDASSREQALEAEFGFYAVVFGFEPADGLSPLTLDVGDFRKRTADDGVSE